MLLRVYDQATDTKRPAASATADDLRRIENDWVDAQKTRNADKLGEILADSWVALGWDGRRTDKAKALADLKSPGNSLDTIEMGHMTVRFFGSTAVVTGSDAEKSTGEGKDTSGKYVWTGLSHHYAQSEVPGKRIEVPVVVQQVKPAFNASGGDHRIDGLANGHAEAA